MTRWKPDAAGRLGEAALELFAERGFEQTTVEDIATRAGLTKRTFFRHFADKREVLFAPGLAFHRAFLDGLAAAPASASALEAAIAAVQAAAAVVEEQRGHAHARRRQAVIAASPELQERELVKLAGVVGAVAAGLVERRVDEATAALVAETAVGVFKVAFERWVGEEDPRPLPEVVDEAFAALRAVATGR
ncbi:TetR family transcriptional regulator [Conexibacter sp. SYSU D00693]|uniref:TetR family transcriptional regulator n=1 Tax=Conexibacter sp. SYSU D00693 TaxID=2812560 RepID=UPI00196A5FC9|nr:TetR family transcriptional regulator [Conexibacter sp. SYSU D00693]